MWFIPCSTKIVGAPIVLPQFFFRTPPIPQIKIQATATFLSYENLLEGFELRNQSIAIDFDKISPDLYQIDIDGNETPQAGRFVKATDIMQVLYLEAFAEMNDAQQKKTIGENIFKKLGNVPPFQDIDLRKYTERIVYSRTIIKSMK